MIELINILVSSISRLCCNPHSQRDDVSVSSFHGNGQRVLSPLVHSVLIGSSLQQQTHLSTTASEKQPRLPQVCLRVGVGRDVSLSSDMCACMWLPSVSSCGCSVQRPLSSQVSVVDVCSVLQQELTGQQRPLQAAQRNTSIENSKGED